MKPVRRGIRLLALVAGAGLFLIASLAGGVIGAIGRDWLARHGLPAFTLLAGLLAGGVAVALVLRRRARRRPPA